MEQFLTSLDNILTPGIFAPRSMLSTALQLLRQSAEILIRVSPERDSRAAWREFQNKLLAFSLFENVDSELELSTLSADCSLQAMLQQASATSSYRSLWLTEGIGHYYADLHLSSGRIPERLLSGDRGDNLPPHSLVPLHAGMGLSFAEWLLPSIEQQASRWLQVFPSLCRANSEEGYLGAAFEALGLATRNLHPHLLMPVDRELAAISHKLQAYFWHGVGRAIYFSPINFLPGRSAPWQGLFMSCSEPPHDLGRLNAMAGFCWALTLVNIRQPEILASFLKHHEKQLWEADACVNGIRSALLLWYDAASHDEHFDRLRNYRPGAAAAGVWDAVVTKSFENIEHVHSILKTQKLLGELFRYQPLSELLSGGSSGN
jgi:hypothetical protein